MPTVIVDFEIRDHGSEHEQYFQGCGTHGTGFANVSTGIGHSLREALADVAEQIAMIHDDVQFNELEKEIEKSSNACLISVAMDNEVHHYASVLYNIKEE